LDELWDKGMSTTKIGIELGVTKNAVIGRARRLGCVTHALLRAKPKPPPRPQQHFPPPGACMFALTPEPPHRFCGEPGYPWCPEHHRRVYQPAKKAAEA
jgi:GcrA cell cycle regulator